MTAATTASPAARPRATKSWGARVVDIALALIGHVAVGISWVAVAAAVMGSLDVARRMVMNSEFAWDTGRLPQPWVIPLALIAAWISHRFFLWAMRRAGGGRLAWGARVVAWSGVWLGVLLGAYLWTPALLVGAQVGPAAGQSEPWGVLGWAAHHARLVVPGLVGAWTVLLLFFSKHSPLVVIAKAAWGALARRRAARSRRRSTRSGG
ncbi:MAG: hypothetical protein Q4F65_07290 [Propionibacteriaceae bacterium]|nr:hypothetical protein [Propionibacteriaceae bacterium]